MVIMKLSFVLVNIILIFSLITNTIDAQRAKYIQLNEDTWRELLTGEWMVSLYAPWCPACKSLKPEWDRFAGWSDDLNIKVAAIDVTENPGLSGRFMVTALPTIYHVKDGVFRYYRGARYTDTFVSYVEDKKWQESEVLSNWKNPDSIQMSLVSYFFKISMALRTVHNHLVEDYGIPFWGSYIIFGVATILLGGILGVFIVSIIDLIFPAKIQDLHLDIDSRKPSISADKDLLGDLPEEELKCANNNQQQLRKRTKKKSNADDQQQQNAENKEESDIADDDDEENVQVKEIVDTKKDT